MNRRVFLAAASIVGTSLLAGCGLTSQRFPTYRYRLTVEVDTPEGLRTGSSVIEVHTVRAGENAVPLPRGVGVAAQGEAVAVDLPGGKTLFALLRSETSMDWASWIMVWLTKVPAHKDGQDQLGVRFDQMLADRDVLELPVHFARGFGSGPGGTDARPLMVTFGNLADPKSVIKVQSDDLAASFGQGIQLRRLTVQLTDDPVTTGIEKRLKWLSKFPESSLDPSHSPTDYSLPATLIQGDFRRPVL